MPSWWGKSSSKEVRRKTKSGGFIESVHRKFKSQLEDKKTGKFGGSQRYPTDTTHTSLDKGSTLSESALSSLQVSPCHSFAEELHAQPLPLPVLHSAGVGHAATEDSPSSLELHGYSKPSPISPLSGHGYNCTQLLGPDPWGDLATASVSSDSSFDMNNQADSHFVSPQASDYESGNVTAINSPSRDQSSIISRRILKDQLKPVNLPLGNHIPLKSTKRGFGAQVTNLQIAPRAGFFSAPESYISSPLQSTMNACTQKQVNQSGCGVGKPCSLVGCGQCCYPGQISGYNPVGDGSFIWPQSRWSPEYSPITSPRMTSPGQGSCVQSGGVTPLHPCSERFCTESLMNSSNDGKPESHKLPLPPVTGTSSCPFPSSYSTLRTPTPRNPCRSEMSTSPVSSWKKGRLIGSGSFGHVYLGFNSETGELCAMKEVALLSDDAKSKESAQQLRQEISLLSCLSHPNIVQYYGSEMVDEKLYIHLEYVSGGSINKILQEYGLLGESAVRSYTQQILAGLAHLHSKNTVHRDIKGANILVDPSGRVKLADFGMAKHITKHSCPLSLKGSPYWIAPEVIRKSSGCNLAVDIWSLGCTVIEMATTKPPWSQYEGVAALFKIGNSKELPAIPYNLSDEGKDFVRRCLMRDPLDRPTAVQLLEHPFVTNSSRPERCLTYSDPPKPLHTAIYASKNRGTGNVKTISRLDLEGVAVQLTRDFKNVSRSSIPHMSKHVSCPVSPTGSPLLHPKASQPRCRRMSHTMFSSHSAFGSMPCTSGNVASPANPMDCLIPHSHESMSARRPPKSTCISGSPLCCKTRLRTFSPILDISRVKGGINSCQCDPLGSQYVQLAHRQPRESCNKHSVLADHVSQQVSADHLR